jgi:hypothetical protein
MNAGKGYGGAVPLQQPSFGYEARDDEREGAREVILFSSSASAELKPSFGAAKVLGSGSFFAASG